MSAYNPNPDFQNQTKPSAAKTNFGAGQAGGAPIKAKARWWDVSLGRPLRARDKVLAGILIIIFLFIFYITLDANKYRAMVRVIEGEDRVGINPTSESLDFGDLSRGTAALRRVNLINGTPIPMFVIAIKTGGISDLMDINKNYFTLHPHEEIQMEFSVYIPASAQIDKNYTGRVYLFKIPTFGL